MFHHPRVDLVLSSGHEAVAGLHCLSGCVVGQTSLEDRPTGNCPNQEFRRTYRVVLQGQCVPGFFSPHKVM